MAIKVLKEGGLVAFPTDTVYCLAADPFNIEAVAKVFNVKKRPIHMALPVLAADLEQLLSVCIMSPLAKVLAEAFYPGGLTMILPKQSRLPSIVTAGKSSVAVRIPDSSLAINIMKEFGSCVIGTSANIHNMKSPVTGKEVREQLGDQVDLIIDGECNIGVESTIIDMTQKKPVIVRQGAISDEMLFEFLKRFKNYRF